MSFKQKRLTNEQKVKNDNDASFFSKKRKHIREKHVLKKNQLLRIKIRYYKLITLQSRRILMFKIHLLMNIYLLMRILLIRRTHLSMNILLQM